MRESYFNLEKCGILKFPLQHNSACHLTEKPQLEKCGILKFPLQHNSACHLTEKPQLK